MLPERSQLTVQLQAAYLGVRQLIDCAPLSNEQINELEEYVRTFWTLALQLCESTNQRQLRLDLLLMRRCDGSADTDAL